VGEARVTRPVRVGKIVRAPCPRGDDAAAILPTLRLSRLVMAGHSASEDARERAYDPAIHHLRKNVL